MLAHRLGMGAFAALGALALEFSACSDASKPAPAAQNAAPDLDEVAARAALLRAPLGHVASRDERGFARFVAAAVDTSAPAVRMSPASAARLHLARHAELLGIHGSIAESAVLTESHALAGGAGIFRFAQRVNGIEVFRARASVVVDGQNRLVSIANALTSARTAAKAGPAFAKGPEAALARAYALHAGVAIDERAVRDVGPGGEDGRTYAVTTAPGAMRILDSSVKRVLYPQDGELVPAYYVELLGRASGSNVNQARAYVIGAKDGRVFYDVSLTHSDVFSYRVWADPSGNHIPTDGPFVDYTPHPTGTPNNARPAFQMPILVQMEGFNKNPMGAADPWLAPTDMFTFGNNVHAYSDRNDFVDDAGSHHNDGYDDGVDVRADVTAPKTFDRTFDTSRAPNVTTDQVKAAVTQIFYVTNWLHDYWYDSGFDEKSGNAQQSNYGRGGVEGDPLRAEGQDEANDGTANNANMSSFVDGKSPRMQMYVWTGTPLRDGTIDNTVVAHEWGHYLHHRLVFCGSPSCDGMSEGWADFDAIMMVIKDGDTFGTGKVYPLAQYATSGGIIPNSAYFGIRRAPYSTDMTKFPFTFRHVRKASTLPTGAQLSPASPDMSEPHNVGEIWAGTLFEAYVNLLAAGKTANRTFDETKRRMADYVVAGMKAAPPEPTIVEQRDALLSAVLATGRMDDFTALAQGFAKRGLGVGAVAPPTTSTDLNEAVENFDFKGNLAFVDAKVDDSVSSCDRDGYLDASESGKVNLRVRNEGWLPLTKAQVKVSSTDPNVTFANGGTAMLPMLAPYQVVPVSIGISATSAATKRSTIPITITLSDPDSLKATADTAFATVFNFDDKPSSSATDDVESEHPAWTMTHAAMPLPIGAWSIKGNATDGHRWHGDDLGGVGDESLVSPDLVVSGTAAFTISFKHHFSFETGPVTPTGSDVYFDGGVLEISADGGATWNDVSMYANPNYPHTIYDSNSPSEPTLNPLKARKAWTGVSSTMYPADVNVSLNLGMQLAGKTVKVRFRIGTDEGTGAAGWDVDNIAFGGITNTPFPSIIDNSTKACGDAGVPNPPDGGPGGPDSSTTTGGGNDGGTTGAGGGNPTGGTAGSPTGGNTGGATSGAGGASSTSTGSGGGGDGGGCGCRAVGERPRSTWPQVLVAIGALAFARRRRRATERA